MTRTRKTPRNPRRLPPVPQYDTAGATIAEVVGWVGEDRRRIQAAYDTEHSRGDDARSSLLDRLTRLGAQERSQP